MRSKQSDRPDWWGPKWNPNTRTFEDPNGFHKEPVFDSDNIVLEMLRDINIGKLQVPQ
jgi:hypothetical protein